MYQDAVKVYQNLPKLLGGDGYPSTVPKKVWLYPLSKLNTRVQRMVHEISTHLINDMQEVMESLHVLEVRINDLISNEVCVYFDEIKANLERLNRLIDGFRVNMMKNLSTLLPKVRGGGEEEAKIAELLEINRKSPFSCEKVTSWINGKEKEVSTLAVYLKEVEKYSIIFAFQPGEMVTLTSSFEENNTVFCFNFNIPAGKDSYLQKMEDYLHGQTAEGGEVQLPPNVQYKSKELRRQLQRFINFVKINQQECKCKYVVTNGFGDIETNKVGFISVFVDACQSEFEPPDQPSKPCVTHKAHNSLRIKWAKPEYGASIVKSYTIHYRSEDESTEEWNEQTSNDEYTLLTKLTPGSLYHFKVTAESAAGSSPESEVNNVRLPPGQPGKPKSTNITHNSVRLEWTKPEDGATIVNSYLIYYHSSANDQWNTRTTTESCLELTELIPGTNYYFKVTAESDAGSSPPSEVCEVMLKPDRPSKPCVTKTTHSSVQLQWIESKQHCTHDIIYSVYYRSVDDPPDNWNSISSDIDCTNIVVSELIPGAQYYFKVAAVSSAGSGPVSEVNEVFLPPDKPGKPGVAEINQDSLRLEWTKPEHGSLAVTTYSIFYRSVDDATDQWNIRSSSDECILLNELIPGSTYCFKVTAESAAGSSLASEVCEVRLPPSRPGKPVATNVTHNTIQLQWSKPDSEVTSYIVLYRCYQFDGWISHLTSDSQESALLTDLLPNRSYNVKVRAVSNAGTSTNSETLLPPPGKPYATNVTHNGLHLFWKKPVDDTHCVHVQCYTVFYRSAGVPQDRWFEFRTNSANEKFMFNDLITNMSYQFKVRAEISTGYSAESELSNPIVICLPTFAKPQLFNVTVWSSAGRNQNITLIMSCDTLFFIVLMITNGLKILLAQV